MPCPAPHLPPSNFPATPGRVHWRGLPRGSKSECPASSGRLHHRRACSSGLPRHTWTRQGGARRSRIKNGQGGGSLPPAQFPANLVDSKTAGRLQRPYAPTACWIGLAGVQQLRPFCTLGLLTAGQYPEPPMEEGMRHGLAGRKGKATPPGFEFLLATHCLPGTILTFHNMPHFIQYQSRIQV